MNEIPAQMFDLSPLYRSIAWAIVPTILAMIILAVRAFRRARPSDQVRPTAAAQASPGLAPEASVIAGIGASARPQETLGEMFLRPTIGMRAITIGLPTVFLYFVDQMYFSDRAVLVSAFDIWLVGILGVLMAYQLIYFSLYELRYDTRRFAQRNWLFQLREVPWSQVISIRSDGGYFFVLRKASGGKVYVPKHLKGIDAFVVRAQDSSQINERL